MLPRVCENQTAAAIIFMKDVKDGWQRLNALNAIIDLNSLFPNGVFCMKREMPIIIGNKDMIEA